MTERVIVALLTDNCLNNQRVTIQHFINGYVTKLPVYNVCPSSSNRNKRNAASRFLNRFRVDCGSFTVTSTLSQLFAAEDSAKRSSFSADHKGLNIRQSNLIRMEIVPLATR